MKINIGATLVVIGVTVTFQGICGHSIDFAGTYMLGTAVFALGVGIASN